MRLMLFKGLLIGLGVGLTLSCSLAAPQNTRFMKDLPR